MTDERLILAIGRLERALARAETAAEALPGPADPALADRHVRLRAETAAAIARLDRLIAAEPQA